VVQERPEVAIVVLNWNGWKDTLACLESLQRVTYPNCRVLVVDNGSTDDSLARIAGWVGRQADGGRVAVVPAGSNRGYAGGNNLGIRRALEQGARYVLILNNDTLVEPDFLTRLVEGMERGGPQVGIAGPKVYALDAPRVLQSVGARIDYWKGKYPPIGCGEVDAGQYDEPRAVDYVSGAAMLVRREAIERVGMMEEGFFLYVEEVDWCCRAWKMGFRVVVVPASRIWHAGAASARELETPTLLYYRLRNRMIFMRRHARRHQLAVFVPYMALHVLLKACGFAARARWAEMRAVLRAARDGARGVLASPQRT
jgi:GT2 family glycosyltransferase